MPENYKHNVYTAQVGDYLVKHSGRIDARTTLARVDGLTKTTIKASQMNADGDYNIPITISRKTSKQFNSDSYWHTVTNLAAIEAEITEQKAKRQEIRERIEREKAERVIAVRKANAPYVEAFCEKPEVFNVYAGYNMYAIEYVDRREHKALMIFVAKMEKLFDYDQMKERTGWVVFPNTFDPNESDWFSSGGRAEGWSLREALYNALFYRW